MPKTVPTLVVVDAADGFVFTKDGEGQFFTDETAHEFVAVRNAALDTPTYKIFRLTPA